MRVLLKETEGGRSHLLGALTLCLVCGLGCTAACQHAHSQKCRAKALHSSFPASMCIYGLSLNAYYVQYNAQMIVIKDENIDQIKLI